MSRSASTSRPSRALAVAAAATLSMSISACGNGESSSADASENPYGPLAELMGWGAETPEESRRKQLEVEEKTAECMRADGWEYVPVDHAAQMPDDEMSELWSDPDAFGERYGYGVVHNYEQWEEPYLLGEEPEDAGRMFEDPNWEYVSQLSESEMNAYYETLYGAPMTEDTIWDDGDAEAAVATVPAMSLDHGCQGAAHEQVYGADPMMSDPDLAQRLEDHWTTMSNDPRLLDAYADWVECMGDDLADANLAGTTIERPDQMYQYVEQLKYEAMGLEMVPYTDGDESGMDFYTAWTDETGTGMAAVGEPEAIDGAELERLRTTELELWAEDRSCRDAADVDAVSRQIEAELVADLRRDFPDLGSGS